MKTSESAPKNTARSQTTEVETASNLSIKDTPMILAWLTFSIVLTSVCHEWGFFAQTGSEFQIFESASDYLANAVIYLPIYVVLTLALSIVAGTIALSTPGMRGFAGRGVPIRGRIYLSNLEAASLCLLLIFMGFLYGSGAPYSFVAVGGFISAWPTIVFRVIRNFRPARFMPAVLILVVPILLSLAFMFGIASAQWQMFEGQLYFLTQGEKTTAARLLRSFDKGVLYYDPVSEHVEFVRWENIRQLERRYMSKSSWPTSCDRIGIFCPEIPNP